jgi:DNA (cytosine-5)-methyltransferase 1
MAFDGALVPDVVPEIVSLFAGPGGWCEGLKVVSPDVSMLGVEYDTDACVTRRAAGHPTLHADVRKLDPLAFRGIKGLVCSPPCPTWSSAGKHAGLGSMDDAIDAIRCIAGGCECDGLYLDHLTVDPRTALALEPLRWVAKAKPEWVVFEQVPQVLPLGRDRRAVGACRVAFGSRVHR